VPCVFADGWPVINSVSMPLGFDRTNNYTERFEKVLCRFDVSYALLSCMLFDAYCKDVSILIPSFKSSRILPIDDNIAEDSLVVTIEDQDCACSTKEQSMSTRATTNRNGVDRHRDPNSERLSRAAQVSSTHDVVLSPSNVYC